MNWIRKIDGWLRQRMNVLIEYPHWVVAFVSLFTVVTLIACALSRLPGPAKHKLEHNYFVSFCYQQDGAFAYSNLCFKQDHALKSDDVQKLARSIPRFNRNVPLSATVIILSITEVEP